MFVEIGAFCAGVVLFVFVFHRAIEQHFLRASEKDAQDIDRGTCQQMRKDGMKEKHIKEFMRSIGRPYYEK